MSSSDGRHTATVTAFLQQPAELVWQTLTDPLATMWLVPKAAYAAAVPGPVPGFGELRCCWVDQVRKGVRSRTVWELVLDEPAGRVAYLDRSDPAAERTMEFQLRPEGSATRVDVVLGKHPDWRDSVHLTPRTNPGQLVERLTAAVAGDRPPLTDPHIMTWAPGAGQHEQTNLIEITAPAKLIWNLVDGPEASELDPGRLRTWRSVIAGVEYRFDVSRVPDGGLTCEMAKVSREGKYQLSTINSAGTQVDYQLLPGEQSWNLRTTHRWTIPIKASRVRDDARQWLAKAKVTAESQAGPPPS